MLFLLERNVLISYSVLKVKFLRLFARHIRVTYECDPFAVGRPGRCIDGTLSPIQISYYFWRASCKRHQSNIYMFIWRMYARLDLLLQKRNKNDPFTVGRNMGKPVIEFIIGYLFLIFSIRFHPPDLHGTRPDRIEINVFAVRSVLRSVVQAFCVR